MEYDGAPDRQYDQGDRAKDVTLREPSENGLTFRALEIPPDIPDRQKHIEILQDLNRR